MSENENETETADFLRRMGALPSRFEGMTFGVDRRIPTGMYGLKVDGVIVAVWSQSAGFAALPMVFRGEIALSAFDYDLLNKHLAKQGDAP